MSSSAPGTDPVVLIDGAPYSPWVAIGEVDIGEARWETAFGAPHGTRGAHPITNNIGNRVLSVTLRGRFDSKAEAATYEHLLTGVLDEMRRFGGWVTYTPHGATRRTYARVLARTITVAPWGQRFMEGHELRIALGFTIEPFLYGDPMDTSDRFHAGDDLSGFTASAAGTADLTNITVDADDAGLVPVSVAGAPTHYLIRTGTGYQLGDHEARAQVVLGAVNTAYEAGVVLKYVDDDNMLRAAVEYVGGTWRIAVWQRLAGSWSAIATTSITTPTAGVPYWVRGRIEGGVVTCEWGGGALPLTVANTATAQLSGTGLTTFGPSGRGKGGLYWKPATSTDRVRRVDVAPFTYRGINSRHHLEPCGDIPGTAPPVVDVDLEAASLSGSPGWLMLAAGAKPQPWSMIHNGGENLAGNVGGDTVGWAVTAVTGVTGAASSIARTTAAASNGIAALQVTTPATANTGAHYRLAHRFRRGRTYRFRVRVRAASATTTVRARLGASGNIASSTPLALTTGWVEHVVDWTPTATVDLAYAAVEVTAATGTTFQIDRPQVYELTSGPPADISAGGHSGRPPWGYLDGLSGFVLSGTNPIPEGILSGGTYAQLDLSVASGGEGYGIAWALSPSMIPPDDHAGPTRDVEVWARLVVSDQFTGGVTAKLSVAGDVFTYEWGSDGVTLTMPGSALCYRIYRLGTINLPCPLACEATTTILQLDLTVAAGTNNVPIGVDWLWLVSPHNRAVLPTGLELSDPSYPALYPDGRVNPQGRVTGTRNGNHQHLGTLSGGLNVPSGPFEVGIVSSGMVPDDPLGNVTAGDEADRFDGGSLHLAVRPRYEILRDDA